MSTTPTNFHMSLAYVILNDFNLNSQFYACPANWSLQSDERISRPFLGAYFLSSGVILTILYLLCLLAMITNNRTPAAKIMISLAICDIPSVLVNSVATGIMGFRGITFCDYPTLVFFLGCNGFGWWIGCSVGCITLAVCRISEMNKALNIDWIFGKYSIFCAVFVAILAPFYGIFFTKPVIFRPKFMSWFFDPGIGIRDSSSYLNVVQPINNAVFSVTTLLLYAYFISFIVSKDNQSNSAQYSVKQRHVILQVAIICLFHAMTSFFYCYMQFFDSPEWLIIVAQISWQMSTGSPSIVYLTLNHTIRTTVSKIFRSNTVTTHIPTVSLNPLN